MRPEAVPTEQRLAAGALGKVRPLALPHAPSTLGPEAVTVPDTSRSAAVVLAVSNTYQVPPAPLAPKFTTRKVMAVPAGTFCSAAMALKSMAGSEPPPLAVLL